MESIILMISDDIKLDYNDVLIVPQRSTISSRKEVNIERTFKFYHSPRTWTGFPVICSNMSSISGKNMAGTLSQHKMITCLHKYHSLCELLNILRDFGNDYVWPSIGYSDQDLQKIKQVSIEMGQDINFCIDVPNAYMECFVNFCKKARDMFPESIIMAGNCCTPEMVQELIIHGGVDICKSGIGGGCFVSGTKVLTKDGYKTIEKIKVGEEVITHTGEYKKVVGTRAKEENNLLIDINGIKCTRNHRFYVVYKKDKDLVNNKNIHHYAKWISAEDLSEDYFLIKMHA